MDQVSGIGESEPLDEEWRWNRVRGQQENTPFGASERNEREDKNIEHLSAYYISNSTRQHKTIFYCWKLTIPKYNINLTGFVGLEVCATRK
jgi:hypothetical protein